MWDVDKIPTGPGLIKRHGVLDVNWDAPRAPIDGAPGSDGVDGVGVPAGGLTGQVLSKASAADYDTEWTTGGAGGAGGLTLVLTQSFTTASAVNVDSCFSDEFDNYTVKIYSLGSSSGYQLVRLRAAGVDYTTGNYNHQKLQGAGGTATSLSAASQTSVTSVFQFGTAYSAVSIDFYGPFLSTVTSFFVTGGSSGYTSVASGNLNVASSFDGFTLYPAAGTITGTLAVYGYDKAV